jgi:hypothetical protein
MKPYISTNRYRLTPTISLGAVAVILLADVIVLGYIIVKVVAGVRAVLP